MTEEDYTNASVQIIEQEISKIEEATNSLLDSINCLVTTNEYLCRRYIRLREILKEKQTMQVEKE